MKRILLIILLLVNTYEFLYSQASVEVSYKTNGVELKIGDAVYVSENGNEIIIPAESITINSYTVNLKLDTEVLNQDNDGAFYPIVTGMDSIIPYWEHNNQKYTRVHSSSHPDSRDFTKFYRFQEKVKTQDIIKDSEENSIFEFSGVIKFYCGRNLKGLFRLSAQPQIESDSTGSEIERIKVSLGLGDLENNTYRVLRDTTFSIKINPIEGLTINGNPKVTIGGGDTINGKYENDTITFKVKAKSISTDTLQPIQLLIAVEDNGKSFEVPIGLGSIQRIKSGWNHTILLLIVISGILLIIGIFSLVRENYKWKKNGTQIKDKEGKVLFTVLSKEDPKVGDRVRVKNAGIYDTKQGRQYKIGGKGRKKTIEKVYYVIEDGTGKNSISIDKSTLNAECENKCNYTLPDGNEIEINVGAETLEERIEIETKDRVVYSVSEHRITSIKKQNVLLPPPPEKGVVDLTNALTVIEKLLKELGEQPTK